MGLRFSHEGDAKLVKMDMEFCAWPSLVLPLQALLFCAYAADLAGLMSAPYDAGSFSLKERMIGSVPDQL